MKLQRTWIPETVDEAEIVTALIESEHNYMEAKYKRENAILAAVRAGLSYRAIAAHVSLSYQSVSHLWKEMG